MKHGLVNGSGESDIIMDRDVIKLLLIISFLLFVAGGGAF